MKKRKINYKNLAIVLVPVILIVVLGGFLISSIFRGCAPAKEETKTVQTEQTTSDTSVVVTIGEKEDGSEKINLDNQCGQAIVSFKIRTSDTGAFGENLLGDSRIKNKATAQWYVKPGDSTYNVEVKLANYTSFVLHEISFSDFNGLITIKYKDGVGYLEYKPKESENTISTYQKELEYKDQVSSTADQSSSAQSSADASGSEDQAQAAADSQASDEAVYDDGASYDDSSVYDDGSYSDDSGYYGDASYDDGTYNDSSVDDGSYSEE